jgi:hypothetical protein
VNLSAELAIVKVGLETKLPVEEKLHVIAGYSDFTLGQSFLIFSIPGALYSSDGLDD